MNLEKLISVAGKPGLFKLISQSKGGFIVEDVQTQKKTSISMQSQVSMLENIAIYTYEEETPLGDIFTKIAEKTNATEAISHKSSEKELREAMREYIEDYDEERVYLSDIKKLFNWYNLLVKNGIITVESLQTPSEEE